MHSNPTLQTSASRGSKRAGQVQLRIFCEEVNETSGSIPVPTSIHPNPQCRVALQCITHFVYRELFTEPKTENLFALCFAEDKDAKDETGIGAQLGNGHMLNASRNSAET